MISCPLFSLFCLNGTFTVWISDFLDLPLIFFLLLHLCGFLLYFLRDPHLLKLILLFSFMLPFSNSFFWWFFFFLLTHSILLLFCGYNVFSYLSEDINNVFMKFSHCSFLQVAFSLFVLISVMVKFCVSTWLDYGAWLLVNISLDFALWRCLWMWLTWTISWL